MTGYHMTKSRACKGKKAHPSHAAATAHMHRLINDEGASPDALNVYECRRDGPPHWHVGHLGRRGVTR